MPRIERVIVKDGSRASGFPRWAWWTVFLATFTFAVPLASPWWSTVFRGEIPDLADDGPEDEPGAPRDGDAAATPAEAPGATLKLSLRALAPDGSGLVTVEREVPYVRGVLEQIQAVLQQLAVPGEGATPLLPEGTRVLDVAFTKAGTLYADFSPEIDAARALGPSEEERIAEGIVLTIADNFKAVRRVVILVDGKAPTPYHFDFSRPLRADDPLFTPEPDPTSSPSPEAGGAPDGAAPSATPRP